MKQSIYNQSTVTLKLLDDWSLPEICKPCVVYVPSLPFICIRKLILKKFFINLVFYFIMYELNTSSETLIANRRKNSHVLTYSSTRVFLADNKQLSDPSLKKNTPVRILSKSQIIE